MAQSAKTSAKLNSKESDFLKIFLESIENQKSISENQKEILRLNKIENRSVDENKKFKILLKAEMIIFDEKIKNEKLQSKIDDDILKTIKKLLVSKIELRDFFEDMILDEQFKNNDLMKQYLESLPPIQNEKSVSSDSVDSGNENSGLIAKTEKLDEKADSSLAVSTQDTNSENEVEAVEDKNDSAVASSKVAQAYSVEDAVVVPDDN